MPLHATRPRLLAAVVACALVLAVWYVTLAPSRIGGPLTPVLVRGTSMLPTYHSGDLVLAYRSPEVRAGQVAVFRAPSGGYVIHRVVAIEGERLITRGDDHDRPDPWPTTTADVVGVARVTVPGAGPYLLAIADPLVLAALCGAVAATVVVWPRRGGTRGGPAARMTGPAALVLALALAPMVGAAAGMTVTVDQLMSVRLTGPFDTYVVTPGGGGCNGQGNAPGC